MQAAGVNRASSRSGSPICIPDDSSLAKQRFERLQHMYDAYTIHNIYTLLPLLLFPLIPNNGYDSNNCNTCTTIQATPPLIFPLIPNNGYDSNNCNTCTILPMTHPLTPISTHAHTHKNITLLSHCYFTSIAVALSTLSLFLTNEWSTRIVEPLPDCAALCQV